MSPNLNAVADAALSPMYREVRAILDGFNRAAIASGLDQLIAGDWGDRLIMQAIAADRDHAANLATLRKRLGLVILRSMEAERQALDARQFREPFAHINPETIAFLEDYAGDMIIGLEDDVLRVVRQTLITAAREGIDVRTQARLLQQVIGLAPSQAQSLTNIVATTYSEAIEGGASMARAQALAETAGARAEKRLTKYRAETIARTECLTGDSVIDSAVVRAVFRRAYDGPIVEVVTSTGRNLSTTPSHPMLTRRGWVPAELIAEGDYLVCNRGQENASSPRDQDVKNGPTPIAEIYDSLAAVSIAERERGRKPDFHGDGAEGDVDILSPHRMLTIGRFAPLYQHVVQNFLAPANVVGTHFCPACRRLLSIDKQPCGCWGTEVNPRLAQPVSDYLRGYPKALSDGGGSFARPIAARYRRAVDVVPELVMASAIGKMGKPRSAQGSYDSGSVDNVADPSSVRAHCLSHLPGAEPGEIEFDRVRSVSIRPFSGHVYNLSTPYGYFTHNAVYTGNTIRAQNAGQQAVWRDYQRQGLLPKVARKVWIVTPDDRLDTAICRPMDGKEAFVEDDFDTPAGQMPYPPAHPRCLPGHSRVTAKGIAATSERWYDGPLVVIQTASGNKLSCTPNHPILTPHGWVAASELHEGGHVISSALAEWEAARRGHDGEHVPASIQQVVEAFGRAGHVASAPVPIAAEDFHGDGLGSYVAVIRTDGLLRDSRDPSGSEHISEPPLIVGNVKLAGLHSGGVLELGGHGDGTPARRFMSGGRLSRARFGRHVGPLERLGLRVATDFHARLDQPAADDVAVDPAASSDSVLRTSGPVFSDYLVSVQFEEFHGMVFNLQTAEGYYLAEGIITHNCRCAMGIISA